MTTSASKYELEVNCHVFMNSMVFLKKILIAIVALGGVSACSTESLQGPATVAGALAAPLFIPFLALSDDCEIPALEDLAPGANDKLIAASCDTWPLALVGWVDDEHLLYRARQDYFLVNDDRIRPAGDVFEGFARHQVFPCTDGKGHLFSIRKKWDSLWFVRYSLANPMADPYVRKVQMVDDVTEHCMKYDPRLANSPDGKRSAKLLSGLDPDGNGYHYIIQSPGDHDPDSQF